ncbi:molybdopterin-dependent oxidoreductase [Planctomicrobium piriforme]|uniref:NADH-quinone oxidoreductase subunit G n=1 Tax=Planctomicrobium piriforme TaxID=1576369 RepID=A0A1I3QRN8_9PLAN|nr:molybdopterin-dependent oxidoreductase [Planctomicrobium piriforme]SFJ36555.1 NADH-quinone oxidoreductase subunit G [Planctomicrobium piriforme]
MPTVTVNNQPVEIGAAERLNCIQAAERIGYEIPAYCYHPSLSVVASCRMCLVEVGERKPDGTVVMQPKLVPGCQTPVKDGTVVVADSPKVQEARKATLEYLLLNHPLDCPTCDQAGECFLQDYSFRFGRGYSRLQEPKNIKADKDHIGDQITLFTDRCIMCTRCVRFTREISGTAELMVTNRGTHEEIDIFPGEPVNNKLAGNVVDLCPVGALCSKDFLYKQRVWWLQSADSVCPDCSTGCSIHVDQNEDHVYRLRPRFNPDAQGHFMCDDGRFGWKYINSEDRLIMPEQRSNGQLVANDWESVMAGVRQAFSDVAVQSPGRTAAVLSPFMTVEEAYLLAQYIKGLDPNASLFMGPVPVVGGDDTYPKDVHGQPQKDVKFTIRAEKCPNRRGVELVLKHFTGVAAPFSDAMSQIGSGKFDAVYVVGGDPRGWIQDEHAGAFSNLKVLAVQDLLPSAIIGYATFVLPGGSFAEREGTFVNHSGLAQEIRRAIRGPDDSRPDGRLLWELCERPGLFRPAVLREEISQAIPEFAALKKSFSSQKDDRMKLPQLPPATTATP